jgi:NAD+ synthase (glutamine-hydrolysing)
MRVAMGQFNSHLGDFKLNAERILEQIKRAKQKNCDLIVFPELSLFGYWPSDLLERKSVVDAQTKELERLHKKIPDGIGVILGCVKEAKAKEIKFYKNAAVFLQKGKKEKVFYKQLLPNYDVFDERRHFAEGDMEKNFFRYKGKKILVTICEDIWAWGDAWTGTRYSRNPVKAMAKHKPDLMLNLSASPFSKAKDERRLSVVQKCAASLKCPVIYVNNVGGQDELIFDGGSIAVNQKGEVLAESAYFSEDLNLVDLDKKEGGVRPHSLTKLKKNKRQLEAYRAALVLGIRDFVLKNNMRKVHLGLSGGIDSALVACLAVDALGPANVTLVAMPSQFNASESLSLAESLAKNLGAEFKVLPIKEAYEAELKSFEACFGKQDFSLVNENLQARVRGNLLMAYSNRTGSMLLATGNKSEFATGYSTLYGDMCGGLAPIGDLLKTEVVALCRYYNEEYELIPDRIITRPPSAELRPDQKDEDSLPPYKDLDKAIQKLVVDTKPARSKIEKDTLKMLYRNEFKRWQAPPILRVSNHAFGSGRRFPITCGSIL